MPTFFLWVLQISHIQPIHGQGYTLLFLDRMQLLFTLVHFLFWQPGRVVGRNTTQVLSCEMLFISRLKRPWSCFPSHFCFLVFVILLSIVLSVLFLMAVSSQHWLLVFHCILSDIKSPRFSRTLLGILVDLINAVVWRVSILPLISTSSCPFFIAFMFHYCFVFFQFFFKV